MSSVVIAGNTSGTITLSAPAVAGTNTITLPASTGTVALTSQLGGGFRTHVLTSGTTYTPLSTVKSFYVFVYGATGGSAVYPAGGMGGAGYSEKYYSSPSGSYTYAIGAGGTSAGTAGGSTTFDVITVTGGSAVTSTSGGTGASGSGGDYNSTGGTGGTATATANGGSGGSGSRAGNGGNGGAAVSSTTGAGGGSGGNNATTSTAGIAATSKAAGALTLTSTLGNITEIFNAGATNGTGASGGSTLDISFIWSSNVQSGAQAGNPTTTGRDARIMIIELL